MNDIYDYTTFNEQSISDYTSIDDDLDDAIDFLRDPDSFRSFEKGLKELLRRKGYSNTSDDKEMADFLISKLRVIHSAIENETVYAWFSGKHRPKIEAGSRLKMYEICFALHLDHKETIWFFNHVYYDRAFNCHTIDEAVFHFAFLHGNTYQEALDIIAAVNNAVSIDKLKGEPAPNYTQFLRSRISELQSTEELTDFLIANKEAFNTWNNSALYTLTDLVQELTGEKEAKSKVDNLKRMLVRKLKSNTALKDLGSINIHDYDDCGLLIREILFDAQNASDTSPAEFILEAIGGRSIQKNTFILDRILCTVSGMPKNTDIPYLVKNNFPSKKVMSDVLDESKISVSRSYDSIRKTIVLLDFYTFWVSIKLGITDISDLNKDNLSKIYLEEANDRLCQCGYEDLYAGNPYDWIFLCSSQSEDPLAFFRAYIADLLPADF